MRVAAFAVYRQHKRPLYTNLLTACKLNRYLAGIDRQAEKLFSRLVKQMAEREGVTEALKAQNQMAWVGRMNNIRNRALEIVNNDIIYYLKMEGATEKMINSKTLTYVIPEVLRPLSPQENHTCPIF